MVHKHRELRAKPAEACRRGKPDQLDGDIADLAAALILEKDATARFDLRVNGRYVRGCPRVDFSGEVSRFFLETAGDNFWTHVAQETARHYEKVHRISSGSSKMYCTFEFNPQSTQLAINNHAGDEGNPIAVAFARTPNHLPWERFLAIGIRDLLDEIYQRDGEVPHYLQSRSDVSRLDGLRADGKVTVRAEYDGLSPHIGEIVVAAEHEEAKPVEELRLEGRLLVQEYIRHWSEVYGADLGNPRVTVNGAGAWNVGGWKTDSGTREAKPQVEYFGAWGCAEDSGRGECPTKPSRTGTIAARAIAVSLVASGFADFAKVTLGYNIGRPDTYLCVEGEGTFRVSQDEIHDVVRSNFSLPIPDVIERFGLRNHKVYRSIVAASDAFQSSEFLWNKPVGLHNTYEPVALGAAKFGDVGGAQ